MLPRRGGGARPRCVRLYAANKSFLSLPIDAINAAALTAMMKDRYSSEERLRFSPGRGPPSGRPEDADEGQRTPTRQAVAARGGKPQSRPAAATLTASATRTDASSVEGRPGVTEQEGEGG